ncbi:catenin delta-1 [Oryzias melastigma]|uniref:Catenin (cadherin-associated protein), delta 1 n=1 Tax=Oryzias melastigma TaxID=30732 RepID=A0A3B3C754_ORYME|nr:catenin delta-1 [Oryzias melastigma]XP_036067604.1 catenin delta-1 [Oryzias melastigma]XP_036067606.1 catenin delta-1 [Oryzias melastigma]XP_036067608.1 catenin delta-1 [Oryzias melastigma]
MEAVPQVQDAFIEEDKSQEMPPVISVGAAVDGTTETPVNENVNNPTPRVVMPSVSDVLSVDGEGSVTTPIDLRYKQGPGGGVPRDYPTSTVPRNYHYGPLGGYNDYPTPPHSEAYASLNKGARMDPRFRPVHPDGYRTLDPSFKASSRNQLDSYAAQPQVARMGNPMEMSSIPRFVADSYGLEDDQRSIGYEDSDYGMGYPRQNHHGYPRGTPHRTASYEGTLDRMSGAGELLWGGGAPLAQGERGSMASLDSIQKRGPGPDGWRQPELSEVIAMLNYTLDSVKVNAAAYLQHLTYKNEKVKSELRRLKGIPAIVTLMNHSSEEVRFAVCGALRNISFGNNFEIKSTIVNCGGVACIVNLLRRTTDRRLIEILTGTLWNLSSNEDFIKDLVDKPLSAVVDEVLVLHSGVEQKSNGAEGGKGDSKSPYQEWEKAFINSTGFLRNVSAANEEHRKHIREYKGLVDSVVYLLKSQTKPSTGATDPEKLNSKLTENCVCVLRNLSYHLHCEIPNPERYKEMPATPQRFGSRKSRRNRENDGVAMTNMSAKGSELLFQKDVIEAYGHLLNSSKNPLVLEAAAGAIQNLCAGNWTPGQKTRATIMNNKYRDKIVEYLDHENEPVVRAMSGALCNLALNPEYATELGTTALPKLLSKLPDDGGHSSFSSQTRMSVISALCMILSQSPEATKTLLVPNDKKQFPGMNKLVQLKNASDRHSEREIWTVSMMLQKVWDHKDVRRILTKYKYKKTDFVMKKNPPSKKKTKESSEGKPNEETNSKETDHLLQGNKDEPSDRNSAQDPVPTLNQDFQLDITEIGAEDEK